VKDQLPLVSLILPVWNGEKTLSRCIHSILQQTYPAWELIIVDDGSTDASGTVAEEAARKEQRIRVVHQPNGGVSRARNRGLEDAKGEYVRFVDADDLLSPDSISQMVALGERTGCGLVIGGFRRVEHLRTRTCMLHPPSPQLDLLSYLHHLCRYSNTFYYGVLWNKLFRLSLIRSGQVSFLPDVHWGEDFIFVMTYLKEVTSVAYLDTPVYDYVFSGKGLTMRQVLDCIRHPAANICMKVHHYRCLKALYHHHGAYPQVKWTLWMYLFRTTLYQ